MYIFSVFSAPPSPHCSASPPPCSMRELLHSRAPPRQTLLPFASLTCFLFSKPYPLEAHCQDLPCPWVVILSKGLRRDGTVAMLVSLLPALAAASAWDTLPTETPPPPGFWPSALSGLHSNLAFPSRPTPAYGRAACPDPLHPAPSPRLLDLPFCYLPSSFLFHSYHHLLLFYAILPIYFVCCLFLPACL